MSIILKHNGILFFVEVISLSIKQVDKDEHAKPYLDRINKYLEACHKYTARYKVSRTKTEKILEHIAKVIREEAKNDKGLPTALGLNACICLAEDVRWEYKQKKKTNKDWDGMVDALFELYQAIDPDLLDKESIDNGDALGERLLTLLAQVR